MENCSVTVTYAKYFYWVCVLRLLYTRQVTHIISRKPTVYCFVIIHLLMSLTSKIFIATDKRSSMAVVSKSGSEHKILFFTFYFVYRMKYKGKQSLLQLRFDVLKDTMCFFNACTFKAKRYEICALEF